MFLVVYLMQVKHLTGYIGRGPKSVNHQVVATLLRQLDFCTLVNRNLCSNHYLKVPMISVAHLFPMGCQKYYDEAHFSVGAVEEMMCVVCGCYKWGIVVMNVLWRRLCVSMI